MYRIDDKNSAIKDAQRLLGINQTGFYDEQTKNAVKEIQSANSYDETGAIDYKTFELILEKFNEKRLFPEYQNYLFAPRFPYRLNDMGENVIAIHSALSAVLEDYVYEKDIPTGSFLGLATIDAANFMREIFGIPSSNEIDERFVSRLMLEKKAIEIKRKYG